MELVGGFFASRAAALKAIESLAKAGIGGDKVHVLSPGGDEHAFEQELRKAFAPANRTNKMAERVGIGGLAAASVLSLALPGIGPVFALGGLAATYLAVAGDRLEHKETNEHLVDDSFLFQDALQRGMSLVAVNIDASTDPDSVREILIASNARTFDEMREVWWTEKREQEMRWYEENRYGDFARAEDAYRRGFAAACDPRFEGRPFEAVGLKLRDRFRDDEEADFRRGYERAQVLRWMRHDRYPQAGIAPQPTAATRASWSEHRPRDSRPSAPSIH